MLKYNVEANIDPDKLTPKTVIRWSNTYKKLEMLEKNGVFKTFSIRAKARRFLENGCITYNKEKKCYECLPIPHYNKNTYEMRSLPNQQFSCTCQFYNRVVIKNNIPGLCCSHVCALKLMLKIWNYNKRKSLPIDLYSYNSST